MAEAPFDIFTNDVDLEPRDEALLRLYEEYGVSVDRLAYTDTFEKLFEEYKRADFEGSKADVFRRLLLLRKAGLLPRLLRPATPA